jgi:hypothetical protein
VEPEKLAMTRLGRRLVLGLALAVGAASACGGGDGEVADDRGVSGNAGSAGGSGADGSAGTAASAATGADGGGLLDGFGQGEVESLTIEPPSAVIDVTNGSGPAQQFTAYANFKGGGAAQVQADWTFDRADLGLVSKAGGLFTAHGTKAGAGVVTATAYIGPSGASYTADAAVTVKLHFEENPAGVDQAGKDQFANPDTAPSGTLLYPYDQTVFARGIPAPELMWNGGAAGDVYKITIADPNVDVTVYTTADPPSRFLPSADAWTALTESNAGDPVSVSVQRKDASGAHQPMSETWTIAQGSLRGTIYYWAVNMGQLMRISPGAAAPTTVFDSGASTDLGTPAPAAYDGTAPPWEDSQGKRCVACHHVSKDGTTLAAIFEKKGSTASPWGSVDIASQSISYVSPYPDTAIYLALTPDGKYLVRNDVNMTMHLADSKTGALIPTALESQPDKLCDPSFSPDAKLLAFAGSVTGSYPVEYSASNLDVMDFDQGTPGFANRRTIVQGGGQAIAFPSFSPDSAWILYQRGDYSRAKYGTNQHAVADLYMADVAKSVGEIPLARAGGAGVLDAKNLHLSYEPRVNPIAVGGYLWVVFVSPRDYGNRMVSTSDPTYENRKQLWVAAVDLSPAPGQDPSHPAFWLPGQDQSTTNMSGFWTLEPCKQIGDECNEGFECCSGFCRDQGDGTFKCSPPQGCAQVGEACTADGDCCDPTLVCIGGFCALKGPQ